jgi:hypothetical protein
MPRIDIAGDDAPFGARLRSGLNHSMRADIHPQREKAGGAA